MSQLLPSPTVWYKEKKKFKLGDICRYRIRFTNHHPSRTEIYFRVKNFEHTGLRAIHLVNGPFILYCHVIPYNYDPRKKFVPDQADENNEVCFKNTIKPGKTFNVQLRLNENSLYSENSDGSSTYEWTCDVMCQIVLNRRASLSFVVMIGEDLTEMRRVSRSMLTSLSKGEFVLPSISEQEQHIDWGMVGYEGLSVVCQDTHDIWKQTPKDPKKPIHLVIVTHGIFSNLTADMLYIHDMLLSLNSDNYLVDGYRGNAGRTEKGIHRLGVGVSHYVTTLISDLRNKGLIVARISFVGHSLGGPVQLYALKHIIQANGENYFEKNQIELKHFVCLASPMLGVLSEMSLWISWFLDLGTLGKTGRDLTLSKKFPRLNPPGKAKLSMVRPVLETLPDDPVHTILEKFESRVVYANAVNDGIVPLRTSALLYLDWQALGDVQDLKNNKKSMDNQGERTAGSSNRSEDPPTEENKSGHQVGQIPEDGETNLTEKYTSFLSRIFNIESDSWSSSPPIEKRRKRIPKKLKQYAKISVKSTDTQNKKSNLRNGDDEENDEFRVQNAINNENESDEVSSLHIPPKASAVESAINSFICPIPSREYIDNPESRTPVIFHDKHYHFDTVPEEENHTGTFSKFFKYYDWRMDKQVRIARKYHSSGLNWRKVLVYLPPDAHNNIVVRRRFANGYGWGVIEHLRQEIFGGEKVAAKF